MPRLEVVISQQNEGTSVFGKATRRFNNIQISLEMSRDK